MKKSSRIAIVVVSMAVGIVIGFFGLIYCMNKALNKALKDLKYEELFEDSDNVVEPEIIKKESDEDMNV